MIIMISLFLLLETLFSPAIVLAETTNSSLSASKKILKDDHLSVELEDGDGLEKRLTLVVSDASLPTEVQVKVADTAVILTDEEGNVLIPNEEGYVSLLEGSTVTEAKMTLEQPSELFVRYQLQDADSWEYLTEEKGFSLLPNVPQTSVNEDQLSKEMTETSQETSTSSNAVEEKLPETSEEKTESSASTLSTESTKETTTTSSKEAEKPLVRAKRSAVFSSRAGVATGTGASSIPKGAITLDRLFAGSNNSARVTSIRESSKNNGLPYSEISLSGSKNWTSIWSTRAYRMDFSTSFEGRNYVNFGTSQADGFAFVMHNDGRGTNALTLARDATDGQNLGVYGKNGSYRSGYETPDMAAVQHSVAVEFDLFTNKNTDKSKPNAFDVGVIGEPHMAYTFPGSLDKGYQAMTPGTSDDVTGWFTGLFNKGQNARVKHNSVMPLNGAISSNIQDGTWYEFRYSFDRASREFSYYLKNPVTQATTPPTVIPWHDLEEELQLRANGNRAYWGFTAANGAASGETKFVFTQPPVELDASIKTEVVDKYNKVISRPKESDFSESVINGESVKVTSVFTVNRGEAPMEIGTWQSSFDGQVIDGNSIKNITAVTNTGQRFKGLNKVDAKTGQIKTTFSDLVLNKGESVTLSYEAQTIGNKKDRVITEVSSAVIGWEKGTNNEATYQSGSAYFEVKTPNAPTNLSLTDTKSTMSQSVSDYKDAVGKEGYAVPFYWQDDDKDNDLEFRLVKNNQRLQTLSTAKTSGSKTFKKEVFYLQDKDASYGENDLRIEVYRKNSEGILIKEPAELTFKLTLKGRLSFEEAPEDLRWTKRGVRESKGLLARDTNQSMSLKIIDSRENNQNWWIGATLVYPEKNKPKFNLVWKNGHQETLPLGTDTRRVLSKRLSNTTEAYHYQQEWSNDQGVLLQNDTYLPVGDYSKQVSVQWKLYDTPEPE